MEIFLFGLTSYNICNSGFLEDKFFTWMKTDNGQEHWMVPTISLEWYVQLAYMAMAYANFSQNMFLSMS